MAGEVQKVEEFQEVQPEALPPTNLPPALASARKWGLAVWLLFLRQREISIAIIALLLVIYFQSPTVYSCRGPIW